MREGLLFESLAPAEQAQDPLIVAARQFNLLRSRAPAHAEELFDWTSRFLGTTHLEETAEETRLRHAACLLSDIAWRAHPDYRGEQSYDLVANASFVGLDHPSRAYLALAASYRHVVERQEVSPQARSLVSARAARPRAHPRRRDARRLYRFGRHAGRIAAHADDGREGPHRLDVAERSRRRSTATGCRRRLKQFARLIGGDPEVRALP